MLTRASRHKKNGYITPIFLYIYDFFFCCCLTRPSFCEWCFAFAYKNYLSTNKAVHVFLEFLLDSTGFHFPRAFDVQKKVPWGGFFYWSRSSRHQTPLCTSGLSSPSASSGGGGQPTAARPSRTGTPRRQRCGRAMQRRTRGHSSRPNCCSASQTGPSPI